MMHLSVSRLPSLQMRLNLQDSKGSSKMSILIPPKSKEMFEFGSSAGGVRDQTLRDVIQAGRT